MFWAKISGLLRVSTHVLGWGELVALRTLKALLGIVVCLFNQSAFSDDEVPVSPVRGVVEMRDLANVASELGLRIEMFDYETSQDHCLHFYVDTSTNDKPVTRHEGGGHCGIAGKHRLTVSWRLDGERAKFSFRRFNREIGQGGMVGGPSISVPNSMASTMYEVPQPVFSFESEAVLLHGAYGWKGKSITDFKVVVELRPNPDGIVGTE